MSRWLFSTVGRRAYIPRYFREAQPDIHIVGSGNDAYAPAFQHCDEVRLLPAIADPSYPAAVLDLVRTLKIDSILTFSDLDVVVLADLRPQLVEMGVNCFFPGTELARLAQDKFKTALMAQELGVRAPKSSLDVDDFEDGTSLVVKPRFGSASEGVSFTDSNAVAREAASTLTSPIIQERIAGDEYDLEICGGLDGNPVRCSVWRKYDSRHGETLLARTVRRPELIELAWSMGKQLKLIGPNDVDLIINDDGPHLIEINTRFGGGYPVSHLAGAGFPAALVDIAAGNTPDRQALFTDDIIMMKETVPFGGSVEHLESLLKVPLPPSD